MGGTLTTPGGDITIIFRDGGLYAEEPCYPFTNKDDLDHGISFSIGCSEADGPTLHVGEKVGGPPDCGGALGSCTNPVGFGLIRVATTCNPFSVTWDATNCDFLHSVGWDTFTFTSDWTGQTLCCQTFSISGCFNDGSSEIRDFIPVAIYNSEGGTLLSSGYVYVAWPGSCTAWFEVVDPSGRFQTHGESLTVTPGDTTSFTLDVASGYQCISTFHQCSFPISETLHAVHPVFGAITYTYSGGSWTCVKSYSYPGFGSCPAKTVTVTCVWDGEFTYFEQWKSNGLCPDNAGATTRTAFWAGPTLACFVPGISLFDAEFSITPSSGYQANLYGGTSPRLLNLVE